MTHHFQNTSHEKWHDKEERRLKHSIYFFLILTVVCISVSMVNGLNIVGLLFFFEGLLMAYSALKYGTEVTRIRWRRKMLEWQESKRRVEARFGKFEYSLKGH